jgi:acid stress-induced BolA-like protein IbaG/YrbA
MNTQEVTAAILAGLPGAEVDVRSEDDVHFECRVVARQFAGLRSVARHQLVYKTLGEKVGREIHALALTVMTPEEAQR